MGTSGSSFGAPCRTCDTDAGGLKDVSLVVSNFPAAKDWLLAGQSVYHTSIVLVETEYYFSTTGLQALPVQSMSKPGSHAPMTNTKVTSVGKTKKSGPDLVNCLRAYFAAGSYDHIAKNCNSFTDCALAFLISRRLPKALRRMEQLGKDNPNMVAIASNGRYKPNPKAKDFDLEKVVLKVDANAWMGTTELKL
mmetsp:Transcript_21206/g.38718  ORF Transcript_21206/g.38718 Transcript_21206/m.38718 type:complete len:193 (+) Transcript_21206:128-706(+)